MTLEPQTPAEGITATSPNSYQGYRSYKVTCLCGDCDHDMHVEVEWADDINDVNVTICTTQTTKFWDRAIEPNYSKYNGMIEDLYFWYVGLVNGLAHRLRVTWDVWMNGKVEYQATTVMTAQQALNFAETLKTASTEIANYGSKE
jgi:hypothetical protein